SGTLHLDLVNGTGITNGGGTPPAGLPFTGETYLIDKGGTVTTSPGAEGNPVLSFGSSGYALFGDAPMLSAGGAIAVLADGRILVGGGVACDSVTFFCTLQLGRYLASGAPDASFGASGRITTPLTGINSELAGISVNADGSFLVAGIRNNGTNTVPFVAR